MDRSKLTLYAVTDFAADPKLQPAQLVELALVGGATMIQLRDKNADTEKIVKEGERIKRVCGRFSAPLIINDNVKACVELSADGVHLGQDDMSVSAARKILGKNKIIGASVHSVAEAKKAEKDGADYLGAGAVFGSATKADTHPMPIELLKKITYAVRIPVVAIGGINTGNISLLKDTGIAGVAVVSGIFGQKDIIEAAKTLKTKSEEITGE